MTTANPFVKAREEYVRNLNLITHAIEDHARYISKMTGKAYDYCLEYVKQQLRPGGAFEFKDPKIVYLERNDDGDRELKEGTLLEYIGYAVKNEHLIAPTFTTYLNPKQKTSILAGYIENNISLRNEFKHAMFRAKMAKNKRVALFMKGAQMNKKTLNNGISGAHVSSSTPLSNKTAHSTLTSNCRSTSAFGNANNEKLLAGNRHYHHPTIAFNNVISIINRTDLNKLDAVIRKYGLHYPTPEEAFACASRSNNVYWRSPENTERLRILFERLEPVELAAFVYVGDLYHIRKHNPEFMRVFIGNIAERTMQGVENPKEVIKQNRSEYKALVVQLFGDMMKGKEISSVEDQEVFKLIAANVDKIHSHICDMTDFIEVIMVTDNVPASISYLPDSVRHVALTSDTDSTIFTVQDWVNWYCGSYEVNDHSNAVAATIIFLAAESITHILANMSANFGIGPDRIFQVAMKNEFKFDAFVPTNIGKHYFALIGCQEGNLYDKYENETKGVHLRSSNVANFVIKKAEDMMTRLMELVMKAVPFRIMPFLKEIADLERSVVESVFSGSRDYLRNGQIKAPSSYTKDEHESPYQHYTMWNSVFGKKYGDAPPPPYSCSKLAVNLKNQRAIVAWIETIKDVDIRTRLTNWNNQTKKMALNMVLVPTDNIQIHGIPEEIRDIVDVRRTVLDVSKVFYIVMEALGVYMINDNITRLFMDEY